MNNSILNNKVQEFINDHLSSDISRLAFKGSAFKEVGTKELIEQIEAKKRCQKKLPTWFNSPNIYYPNKLNIEQTSSEVAAKYKCSLISGKSVIDLTGGFGVDCLYFSKNLHKVTHCEINEELSLIVKHNYNQLKVTNIETVAQNGISYLQSLNKSFDWIYIDPSRRHDSKGKVFFLKDCLPNVPENLATLFKHTSNVLIKTSPLLDLSIGLDELKNVKEIHIVAINNEVKELLWVLERGYTQDVAVKTINIKKNAEQHFSFQLNQERIAKPTLSKPLTYLYEPNAAILKSGVFNFLSQQFNVFKLHQHSHLYTSEGLISEFPGRSFKVDKVLPYDNRSLKKEGILKANIATRNFPMSVQNIKKKFKIKDGGNSYLFFTTDSMNNRIIIKTSRL